MIIGDRSGARAAAIILFARLDGGLLREMGEQDSDWYFAYGSNLDPKTFCGRRRMQPLEARRVLLPGFALKFDLGVGTSNRGVANVKPVADEDVWGVAYRIKRTDLRRLDRSEGVHRNFYRRIRVSVVPDTGAPLEAFTYTSNRGQPDRLPSARYLGLIVIGARHHGLPDQWIETLRAWPLAHDERKERQRELF